MPAWQGSIQDTVEFLIRAEGKDPDEAAAIAHALAKQEGATKSVMLALETAAGVTGLCDASLVGAHERLHRFADGLAEEAEEFTESAIKAHGWVVAEFVRREIEHPIVDALDQVAHRATQSEAKKAATHNDPDNPGVMVAWMVPEKLGKLIATEGGEPVDQLHLTLAYLGRLNELDDGVVSNAASIVKETVAKAPALRGAVRGMGRFPTADFNEDGTDAIYAAVDVPGLVGLRQEIVAALEAGGVPVKKDHDWTPHISLAYVKPETPTPPMPSVLRNAPLTITEVTLAQAGDGEAFPLAPSLATEKSNWIVKRATEQRYTLSVAYPVDQLDAHGEFINAEDLEEAAWKYMVGSRRVGIMHEGRGDSGSTGAGVIVESYIYRGPEWRVAGEIIRNGDWLVGIIWSPEAWQQIQAGNFAGLSFQGLLGKISAPPPEHKRPS